MATRAQRGKCVLPADNPNVESLIVLLSRSAASAEHVRGVIDQVAYDAWQIAHDEFCDFGSDCTDHTNPLTREE